jgi:hypothetical protein
MAAIATIRGTAIRPGVSRNGRLYTRELIATAVAEARERLASGPPLTMLTHHGAADDSTRIVGRLTELTQRPDGSAAFVAELADTQHGRDLAALVTGDDPFLDGVSIRGWWNGPVRTVQYEGERAETGDSLTIDGLDFTKTPGVPGARVEGVGGLAQESADGRILVFESVTEASAKPNLRPYGDVPYADPGYLPDKKKRYPLDTKDHARSAWSFINQAKNSGQYTAAQLKRIKGRIKGAMRKFGVTVTAESLTRLGEVTEFYPDMASGQGGGFCIDAYNGPTTITLRCCGIDPAELRVIAAAAMDAAVAALAALDPDMDGDLDIVGAPHADTDGDVETRRPNDDQMEAAPITAADIDLLRESGMRPGEPITAARLAAARSLAETAPPNPAGATPTPLEVPAVSEQPTPAAETANTPTPAPAVIQLTQEQFQQLIGARNTPAAEAAPTPEPVAETDEQRIARLVSAGVTTAMESLKADLRQEMQAAGPRRVGLAIKTKTAESDMPTDKAFHELPAVERDQLERDGLLRAFGFAE